MLMFCGIVIRSHLSLVELSSCLCFFYLHPVHEVSAVESGCNNFATFVLDNRLLQ